MKFVVLALLFAASLFAQPTGPQIDSISPTSASAGRGDLVLTINGARFPTSNTVVLLDYGDGGEHRFDIPQLTSHTATQIVLTIPALDFATPVDYNVFVAESGEGLFNYSNGVDFPVFGPFIYGTNPATLVFGAANYTFNVSGSDFIAGSKVLFNDTLVTTTFVDANTLTVTVPGSLVPAADDYSIVVQNNVPNGPVSNTDFVTFRALPAITSINPQDVITGSQDSFLDVFGTNFFQGDKVLFDGHELSVSLYYYNNTDFYGSIPGQYLTPGPHQIVVQTPDNHNSNTAILNVLGVPNITSISPPTKVVSNAQTGTFTLTLNGTNFWHGMELFWDAEVDTTQYIIDVDYVSTTQATVQLPNQLLTLGTHTIFVLVGESYQSNTVNYVVRDVPAVTSVSNSPRTAGNGPVTITVVGTNFANGDSIAFGTSLLTTTFVNQTQLTGVVTANLLTAGTKPVGVLTPDFVPSSNTVPFVVQPARVITSLTPNTGNSGAGFQLAVNGVNFISGDQVVWDSTTLTPSASTPTVLTVSIPANLVTVGGHLVRVLNPADGALSAPASFNGANLPPTIATLIPPSHTVGFGQFNLGVTGTNLTEAMSVLWDGKPLSLSTFVSSTRFNGVVPANLATVGSHTVTVGAGNAVSNALVFQMLPAPILDPIVPNTRVAGQGFALPLSGTNFTSSSLVLWDNSQIPATFGSSTLVTASVDSNHQTVGTHTISIVTIDGIRSNSQILNITAVPVKTLTIAVAVGAGAVNTTYSGLISAAGGTEPYAFAISNGSLPPGLTLFPDGYITGKPTAPGHFPFTAAASDSEGRKASQVTFIDITGAVNVSGSLPAEVALGTPLNTTFSATGGTPPYSFSGAGNPGGTQFSGATLSGAPTETGRFSVTVTVRDSVGSVGSATFPLVVTARPLAIDTSALPDGQVGSAYSASVIASGGAVPYAYTASGLPDGLAMSSSGGISGTPTAEGIYSVSVTASDSANAQVSKTIPLNIGAGKVTLTGALSGGTVGVAYSGSMGATGGTKPYTFTFGGLPPGLTGASNGSVSGTPTSAGDFTATVTVTDAKGGTASSSPHIVVVAATLVMNTRSLPGGTVGTPYAATVLATGGTGTLTYSAAGLPPGLSISATGSITGTPTAAGTFNVSIAADDTAGGSVNAAISVTIVLPPAPPATITSGGTPTPGTQTSVGVTIDNPYPVDMTVTLTLTFAPDSGPNDPNVQFATGGRTTTLTVPAGQTTSLSNVGVQLGTTAGVITITATQTVSGDNVTPSPAPSTTIRVNPAAPTLTGMTAVRTSTGFTVTISGFASSKEISSANITFTPAAGANLQTTSLTIPVDSLFVTWFSNPASAAFGSQFTLTIPFTIQGDSTAVVSVSATLTNKVGTSGQLTATIN